MGILLSNCFLGQTNDEFFRLMGAVAGSVYSGWLMASRRQCKGWKEKKLVERQSALFFVHLADKDARLSDSTAQLISAADEYASPERV